MKSRFDRKTWTHKPSDQVKDMEEGLPGPTQGSVSVRGADAPLQHTAGPWVAEVHELSSGYSGIVYAANWMRVGTDHLSEADARLISAAPELLEALKWVMSAHGEQLHDAFDAAHRAISKAEGRQP